MWLSLVNYRPVEFEFPNGRWVSLVLRGTRHRAKPARLMRLRRVLALRALVLVLGGDVDGDLAAQDVADHLGLSNCFIWNVHLGEVEVHGDVAREHLARDLLDELLQRHGALRRVRRREPAHLGEVGSLLAQATLVDADPVDARPAVLRGGGTSVALRLGVEDVDDLLADLLRVSVQAHAHNSLAQVKSEQNRDATEVGLASAVDLVVHDLRLVREHARRQVAAREASHLRVRLADVDRRHAEVGRQRVIRDRAAQCRSLARRRSGRLTRASAGRGRRRRRLRNNDVVHRGARGRRHLRGMVAWLPHEIVKF